ncbi:MAG: glycosyltransferase family 4 protein [Pseudomonadota bacterium]
MEGNARLIVANNMIMEAETAHVLQTGQMLAAFARVVPEVSYYWPDFGRRVAWLDTLAVTRRPIPCHFRHGARRYAEFVWRLGSQLREHPPELLFTRNLGVALAAQRVARRVFLELHQGLSSQARRVAPWLGPRVWIVAISEGLRRHLIERDGFVPERVRVCHDGVDVERFITARPFLPLNQRFLPDRGCRLHHLYYGTMRPERGLDLIREAARQLPDQGFVLVGGTLAEVAKVQAAGLDLPNIRILPAIAHCEIPRLIRSFDTVLLPYTRAVTTHAWMSPLKLFEVMASGIPAVISRLPSILEVVDDSQVAFIDSDHPESLIATLRGIAADPEAARTRAQAAQALAMARYSWEHRARDILDL